MGYFKDAVKGFSWMGLLRIGIRSITFVKIAVLARLLTPDEFGIFAIASLILGLLEIITETGINIFFLQEEGELEEYLDTAWVVSIFRGLLISSLLLLVSPLITSFFNAPGALSTLRLISVVPFIRGFINPSIVKFQKKLMFDKEFVLRLLLFLADGIVAVSVAYLTRSASSFVWGMAAGVLIEVVFSHLFISPKPKIRFDMAKVKKVIGRGKWVTGAVISNYLFQEGDDIFVGRLLGAAPLGIYQMAYKISSLPITEVSDVIIKVALPVYVKIKEDRERLLKAFVKTTAGVVLIVVPIGFLFLFFAEPVVRFLIGDKWLEAVGVIKLLSFFGVGRAIVASTYPLFLSLKKQEYVTIITLVGLAGLAATVFPLVQRYQIMGAGISALIGLVLTIPVTFYFVAKTFKELK